MNDILCYKTEKSCGDWKKAEKAMEVCTKQQSCGACVSAHDDCGWVIEGERRCVRIGVNWRGGAGDEVVRHFEAEKCESIAANIPPKGSYTSMPPLLLLLHVAIHME